MLPVSCERLRPMGISRRQGYGRQARIHSPLRGHTCGVTICDSSRPEGTRSKSPLCFTAGPYLQCDLYVLPHFIRAPRAPLASQNAARVLGQVACLGQLVAPLIHLKAGRIRVVSRRPDGN